MSDLSEFLLARIAEDDEAARATSGQPWSATVPRMVHADGGPRIKSRYVASVEHDEDRAHIAHWDPARVLAECAARRRIVELHREETKQQWVHEMDGPDRQETEYSCVICGWFPPGSACDTLRLLALPYASHPDYDPEWRP